VGQWLGSFERAAIMQVIAALVAFAIVTRVPEEYAPAGPTVRRHWVPRSLIAPGVAVGFVNVHYPVVAGFLILHLARHGHSGPAAFSAYALMILLSRFFLGGLPDRMHPAFTYYGGLAAMGLGLIVIAVGPAPRVAVSAAALLGFGFSFPWSSVAANILRRTPDGERGSVVGVLSAFYDLFVGVSSLVAGTVAAHFGYSAAFLMAAAALGAAAYSGRYVFPPGEPEGELAEEPCYETSEP
jgi:MFS family permease